MVQEPLAKTENRPAEIPTSKLLGLGFCFHFNTSHLNSHLKIQQAWKKPSPCRNGSSCSQHRRLSTLEQENVLQSKGRSLFTKTSKTERQEKKWNADFFYYAFKLSRSFQVKWSLMFSLDCQVTPVRKPHALLHNKQPLLKISPPRKNYTPHPRAGWSVTLMLKPFWQGREHGRVPGTQIKMRTRRILQHFIAPSLKKTPLIFGVCKPHSPCWLSQKWNIFTNLRTPEWTLNSRYYLWL